MIQVWKPRRAISALELRSEASAVRVPQWEFRSESSAVKVPQ